METFVSRTNSQQLWQMIELLTGELHNSDIGTTDISITIVSRNSQDAWSKAFVLWLQKMPGILVRVIVVDET